MAMNMASNGNGASRELRLLSVRSLVHRKLTKAQRALLGVAIIEGHVRPCDLPQRIVAEMVGCSVAYIGAAQRLSPTVRQTVDQGLRPLVSPTHRLPRPVVSSSGQQLAEPAA
jgi:hypothetical protein